MAAPGGVAGINEIVIPKGVEVIDKYAFYGRENLTDGFILSEDNLQSVVFPSTLKKIDDFAFVHTDTLKCIEFPESLEYIGTCNFSGYYTSRKNDEITIHIGKNVRFIGKDCFSAYRVTEYSVDEANVRYSEKDGNIMNASGEVVEFRKAK